MVDTKSKNRLYVQITIGESRLWPKPLEINGKFKHYFVFELTLTKIMVHHLSSLAAHFDPGPLYFKRTGLL